MILISNVYFTDSDFEKYDNFAKFVNSMISRHRD